MNEIDLTEKTIYLEAAGIADIDRRAAYLDVVCNGNEELRNRVQSLLDARAAAGTFLDSPPVESALAAGSADNNKEVARAADKRIGPYKLLEQIGEGGFGVVYMADQLEPIQRRVALKIIKAGMDTKQVIARFEAERQALALMDDPNIAKVLDAGTTETGRPYFVMELVRGVPVMEYCDHRNLSTEERLRLFLEICSAIQHAHQKGIIHRDIKPSNILVSTSGDRPVPKVIDFGIAKATQGRLTDKTLFTNFRQFIGTPAYMSPEQAQMSAVDVDTRSDIYSLGVLLYELLTGKTPLDSVELQKAGYEELCRHIREAEAPTPSHRLSSLSHEEISTLARNRRADPARLSVEIQGDLDWIVMKAVEKDRSRRYSTAEALAEDIKRHLNCEAVTAAPPSTSYLIRKFVHRNRRLIATGGAITATLLIASIVSTWAAFSANKARKQLAEEVVAKENAVDAAIEAKETAEAERLRARKIAYASDMNGADQALQLHNLGLARFYVNRNLPAQDGTDLRNWEWRALWRQCRGDAIWTFGEPADNYASLGISPDQRWVAAGEHMGAIRIWDLETRELAKTLVAKNFSGGVFGLAFSPNGDRLYGSTSYVDQSQKTTHGLVKSWLLPSFEEAQERIELGGKAAEIRVSHDGNRLATLSADGQLAVWRLPANSTAEPLVSIETGAEDGSLAFSPDDELLAVGLVNQIRILDTSNLRELVHIPHPGRFSVEFSPDGEILATAAGITASNIRLYRARTGEPVGQLRGHSRYVHDIAYSRDGLFLASASADNTIRIWNTQTLAEEAILLGHNSEVHSVAFTSDGRHLISGGIGEICVWDASGRGATDWPITRDVVPYVTNEDWHRQYSQASYSPDMKWLATRNQDYTASLRSPETLEERIRLTDLGKNIRGVRFSPVENLLAVGDSDGHVSFVSVEAEEPRTVSRRKLVDQGRVSPVGFSRDGKRLLLVIQQATVTQCVVWSVADNQEVQSWSMPSNDECAAISPDGQVVVTGHSDGTVQVWPVLSSAEPRKIAFQPQPLGIAFCPSGDQFAVGVRDLHVLDTATCTEVGRMLGHKLAVHSVHYSPDGSRIVTGGGGELEAVKVWDVTTQQELMTLTTRGYSFRQAEFSPDGNSIMAIGGNHALSVWHAPTLEESCVLRANQSNPP